MRFTMPSGAFRDGLYLYRPPDRLAVQVLGQTKFSNPLYLQAKQHSPWGTAKGIPQYLEFAQWNEAEQTLRVSRGAYSFLDRALQSAVFKRRWKDERVRAPVEFPTLLVKFNPEQRKCIDCALESLRAGERPLGNLLMVASTAVGKTIMQAGLASILGQRTLILTQTEPIKRAWLGDLLKAFKLTSKAVGLIQQSKWRIGEQFTIASVQTLGRRRAKWQELNEQFGTVIVDEAHTVTGPTLFDFLDQSPAKYLIGATATQEARSGRNFHLRALLGPPVVNLDTYGTDTKNSLSVGRMNLVTTNFQFRMQSDNIDFNKLNTALSFDEARNALIVANVQREWSEGRVVLVATRFREHATLLLQMLQEAGVTNANLWMGNTNNKFYLDKLLKLIGRREITCLVATLGVIKVGANIPMLDTLHIASPIASRRDVEQLIGRIRRVAEGKQSAQATYYLDSNIPYLVGVYNRIVVPILHRLKLPAFEA